MKEVTVIHLEMHSLDELRPKSSDDPNFRIEKVVVKQWQLNRFLYQLVGGDWKWTDKLGWSDGEWRRYVEHDGRETFVAWHQGAIAGYFELLAMNGAVQIAYFGLAPQFIGMGYGGALLTRALEEAWALNPRRVWVDTCSLDHPAALANYQARGLRICKTEPRPVK